MKRVGWVVVSLAYAGALVWASIQPVTDTPTEGGIAETARRWLMNALHVPAYGVLTWLTYRAMRDEKRLRWGRLIAAGAIAAAIGVWTEAMQMNVPGRYADVTDGFLNAAGVIGGTLVVWRMKRSGKTAINAAAQEQ